MSIPRRIHRRAIACVSAVLLSLSPTSQWARQAHAAAVNETEQQVPETETPAVQAPEKPEPAPAPTIVVTPEPPVETEASAPPSTPAPTDDLTPGPVQQPSPSPAGTEPAETPSVLPTETQKDAPKNASEFPSFASGYARVLGGASIYTQAHDRLASKEILHLGDGELVLVGGRTAFIPPPGEETPDAPDWFNVTVWDGEGRKVSGYVPGAALMPLSAEELAAQEQAWQAEPASRPQDGIPQVGGLYIPQQNDDPLPDETMVPVGTLSPDVTPFPTEIPGTETTPDPETTLDPDTTPYPWEVTPAPAETPEPPEPSPGPLVDILEDEEEVPEADVLADAKALLDLPFDANTIMERATATTELPDVYAPNIQDVQIMQDATKPGRAKVVAIVRDQKDPSSPFATVSGMKQVLLHYPAALGGQTVEMLPTGKAHTYAVAVYGNATLTGFTVTAEDIAGNTASFGPFDITIGGNVINDTQAPFLTNVQHTPPGGKVDAVVISCNAEDLPNGTEDVSGLAIVRARRVTNAKGRAVDEPWGTLEFNKETGSFELSVMLNGGYEVEARDWAGNTATDTSITIGNIRAPDTWPPTIEWVDKSTEEEYQEFLTIYAKVYDEQNPNDSKERVSGVVDVSLAYFYYEDEDTGEIIYDEEDQVSFWSITNEAGDPDLYAVSVFESGEYVVVATDEAGNKSFHILVIENIEEKPTGEGDPDYVAQKDDDGDGMLTQSEYRLGYNPALWDSNGDGISDGMEVLLGIDYHNMLEDPTPSLLTKQGPGFFKELQQKDILGEAIAEKNQANARASYNSAWSSARNILCWWNPRNGQMAVVSSNGILRMEMQNSEKPKVLGALSFYALDLGKAGNHTPRTLQCAEDGTMALVYDREEHAGLLRTPAYLVDMIDMVAYPVPDTQGARDIRLSDDGKQLAVLRKNTLEIINLATGDVWQTKDRKEVSSIEMLHFLPNGHLVTRVTPLGYSAYLPEGEPEVGDTISLPLIKKFQDIGQITMYDLEGKPFTMKFQALLRNAGVFVSSEDEKVKTARHMAPSSMVLYAQGTLDDGAPTTNE